MPLLAVLGITLATWIALAVVLSVTLLILIVMRRVQRFAVGRLGIRN